MLNYIRHCKVQRFEIPILYIIMVSGQRTLSDTSERYI